MAKTANTNRSRVTSRFVDAGERMRNPLTHVVETIRPIESNRSSRSGEVTVRSETNGKFVTVRGAGALKDSDFAIDKGIDLTKPIAAQTARDMKKDMPRNRAARG